MDLLDIFQQYRIERNRTEALTKAGEAKHKALDNTISIVELEQKIEHLSMVSMALCELLEEVGFSKSRILSKIEEIDLRDGKRDGKLSPSNTCSGCSRVVASRHTSCLYCGTKVSAI